MKETSSITDYDRRQGKSLYIEPTDNKRVIDPKTGVTTVKLFTGDWHISHSGSNEMLVTILGSCISACIRDPLIGIGGMNHFLVPKGENTGGFGMETRFGVNAMEQLLNSIYKLGGRKERLEIKVFGGGNVTNTSIDIGTKNSNFIREFLEDEGFKIAAEDLEGTLPRRLHYTPETGKVMLRKLQRQDDKKVAQEEAKYQESLVQTKDTGEVDLF